MSGEGGQAADRMNHGSGGALQVFKDRYLGDYAAYLATAEQRLAEFTGRPGHTLGESCSITLEAGGKRLRPLLVFLSMGNGLQPDERFYAAAVSVELVHMATLVHDDVLDEAELRRGEPTVVARYGQGVSISAGDYMFSTAFEALAEAGSSRAVSMLAETSLDLSKGELLQMSGTGDLALTVEIYEERCRLKTASLFSTACRLGALLSECSEQGIEAMGEYGTCIGLAFQISDDILDFSVDSDRIGKRFGADIKDGTVTLPLIMALERDPGLAALMGEEFTDERLLDICRRVETSGALKLAREQAYGFVRKAVAALERVEGEIGKAPLELIAEATVDRRG